MQAVWVGYQRVCGERTIEGEDTLDDDDCNSVDEEYSVTGMMSRRLTLRMSEQTVK
jgi:hypothetical protein